MLRNKSGLFQTGLGIFLLGLGVKVALVVGNLLNPVASIAIGAGVVIMIIGLVAPGRR